MSERLLSFTSAMHFQTAGLLLPQLSVCLHKHSVFSSTTSNNISINQFYLLVIPHLSISTVAPLLKEQYES